MCVKHNYEVGLKMVDIKLFLAALKISWLKRILHDDGKLSKILQAMCPLVSECKTAVSYTHLTLPTKIGV